MSVAYQLENKTVFITGASSGLGEYFAKLFAEQKCHLILAARRLNKIEALASTIKKEYGINVISLQMDVSEQASIEDAIGQLPQDVAVDVLVNNAGIADPDFYLKTSAEDMQRIMATNFEGAWMLTQKVCERMIEQKTGGSIINIASIVGMAVTGKVSVYAASKAALIHSSKAQALELARHGIRVNCLAPGYIETPLNTDFFATEAGASMIKRIPQRRLGQYESLAGPILLLASSLSDYMTGSVITVDGGHLCRTL